MNDGKPKLEFLENDPLVVVEAMMIVTNVLGTVIKNIERYPPDDHTSGKLLKHADHLLEDTLRKHVDLEQSVVDLLRSELWPYFRYVIGEPPQESS